MTGTKTKKEVKETVENKKPVASSEPQEDIFKELTSDKIGNYVIENSSKVLSIIGIITALFLGYYAYNNLVLEPKSLEGFEKMYASEAAYKRGEFKLAIDGDEKNIGLADIADEYSGTKAGNLSNFYVGVSYLQLGEYDNAIKYLSDYSGDDLFSHTLALGALGDAHAESGNEGNTDKAISYYKKAAANKANDFLTPLFLLKTARALDLNKDYAASLKYYNKIKKEYPNSYEGRDIEKFIARAEARVN